MAFNIINTDIWDRKEYFNHYYKDAPCTYSLTVNLDITELLSYTKKRCIRFSAVMIYLLSLNVNKYDELKTSTDSNGNIGVFDFLYPCYTVFHRSSGTFSNIWSEYSDDFSTFYGSYLSDINEFGAIEGFTAKPDSPKNIFHISILPWLTFSSFNLNIDYGSKYLLPIFTVGKYFKNNSKIFLPLFIRAHHSVCDGFHVSKFIESLQCSISGFDSNWNPPL